MKIKTVKKSYEEVLAIKPLEHEKPGKQPFFIRMLLKAFCRVNMALIGFECKKINMERLEPGTPCLVLMNHSSFTDLKIAFSILESPSFHVVSTQDSLVGKEWLMRWIGCIPTKKFITDLNLVRDMIYVLKELKSSVLMYPEAAYSLDGTAGVLPGSLAKCLKMLGVPIVMIRTYGAFARDPLYNNLQIRKVKVQAEMEYLLSAEEVKEKSVKELEAILEEQFSFDQFRWQQENKVRIKEKFRADGLNRVLYKCPHCGTEGQMLGKGTELVCEHCQKVYELTEYGYLEAKDGDTKFSHVPAWFQWERDCVRQELKEGTYRLDVPVDISVMVDSRCLYKVGSGRLLHTAEGFHLTGCDGALDYTQKANASYTLNADFFWYEIGDVIGIGNDKIQYYCFPKECKDVVAKAKLATEEQFKLLNEQRALRTKRG